MGMTDPIADLLTRIRNANHMKHAVVEIPASKVKLEILAVMQQEGYVNEVEFISEEGKAQGIIRVNLKYTENKDRVIHGIRRISKPGLRVYAKAGELPQVLNGLGVAIISTSQGMMADRHARKAGIGGEVIAYVW